MSLDSLNVYDGNTKDTLYPLLVRVQDEAKEEEDEEKREGK